MKSMVSRPGAMGLMAAAAALVVAACGGDDDVPGGTVDPDGDTGQSSSSGEPNTTSSSGGSSGASSSGEPGDGQAPTVVITSPREGLGLPARQVFVTGEARDNVAVTEIGYELLDVEQQVVASGAITLDGDRYEFEVQPTPGANTLQVTAKDADGHVTVSKRSFWFGHRVSGGNSQGMLLSDGALFTWGRNELGQLGNGTLVGNGGEDAPWHYRVDSVPNLVSVVTRQTYGVALQRGGKVFTWGAASDSQLGRAPESTDCGNNANLPCSKAPAAVPGVTDAVQIAGGTGHVLVLKADGTVISWGQNNNGQLGRTTEGNDRTPAAVPGLSDIVQVAAGAEASYAVTRDGHVFAWGFNNNAQLGDGTTNARTAPARIDGLSDVRSLAAPNHSALVLLKDGTLRSWGQNNMGQVGNGTNVGPVLTPSAVLAADGQPLGQIDTVAADGFVGMALAKSGQVYAWGLGGLGQLGQGVDDDNERVLDNSSVALPVKLPTTGANAVNSVEIEVGAGGPAFALGSDGVLYGWGWNFQGSVGRGDNVPHAWAMTTPAVIYPVTE